MPGFGILVPRAGFNWLAVSWGGPDQPRAEFCCYCDAPLGDGLPLIIWNREGWVAEFCWRCQGAWWGLGASDADPG